MSKSYKRMARKLDQQGTIHPGLRAALEANNPTFFDQRDWGGVFFRAADENIAIRLRVGRFPRQKDPDQELSDCGVWWANRRRELRNGRLATDRVAYLDERMPGWQHGNAGHWTVEYEGNIAIHARLGKFPLANDPDKQVADSGVWWTNRRRDFGKGRLTADRVAYLDERVPGWQHGNAGPWTVEYDRNIAIRNHHGKFPAVTDQDNELAACGRWWRSRRHELSKGRLAADRAAHLDQHCPGWQNCNRSEPKAGRSR